MKKYIAPIVVAVIMLLYYLAFFCGVLFVKVPQWFRLLLLLVPLLLGSVVIYVLLQRIEEIKGGEEDEASKY